MFILQHSLAINSGFRNSGLTVDKKGKIITVCNWVYVFQLFFCNEVLYWNACVTEVVCFILCAFSTGYFSRQSEVPMVCSTEPQRTGPGEGGLHLLPGGSSQSENGGKCQTNWEVNCPWPITAASYISLCLKWWSKFSSWLDLQKALTIYWNLNLNSWAYDSL